MAALVIPNARRPRQFHRIDRQTDDLVDNELRRRYRFGASNLDRLVTLLGDRLQRQTQRNNPLTPRQQIMIALRFYASGGFLQLIGDTFGVDIATVSRTVTRVTDVLFDLKDEFIKFLMTDNQRLAVKRWFYTMRGFPGVGGCIDGTHVCIIAPLKAEERAYVNRKMVHSINVQATCDHLVPQCCILINRKVHKYKRIASWPGSCHDSHVFRVSNLCHYLETHHQDLDKGVLLGDSGYPCKPFLLTPYPTVLNERQERYNRRQMGTRNIIERVFGMWKRKFHVLHSEENRILLVNEEPEVQISKEKRNYSLHEKRAIEKKLDATERSEVEITYTGGSYMGVTTGMEEFAQRTGIVLRYVDAA